MAFFVCVSNTDDHLRNHAFLLEDRGWRLAPAYDVNPNPDGEGLSLNISEDDNRQDLDLVREVAPYFRVADSRAVELIARVKSAVAAWRAVALERDLRAPAAERMRRAFRLAT